MQKFCYTYASIIFILCFVRMANAFVPQGSSFSEKENADVFDENEIQNQETPPASEKDRGNFEIENETVENELPTPEVNKQAPEEQQASPRVQKIHPHPSQTYSPPDPVTFQIEKIMEQGIGEAYQELTPIQKQQFKIKGEQTAKQIKQLLQTTHVKVKKIFRLLLDWLKLLPGINRFFLMQEAKIKTDQILSLKNRERQK